MNFKKVNKVNKKSIVENNKNFNHNVIIIRPRMTVVNTELKIAVLMVRDILYFKSYALFTIYY